jgi:hypothetical protein
MSGKTKQKSNSFITWDNLVGRGWIPNLVDLYISPSKTLLTKDGRVKYYSLETVINAEKFLNRTQIKWHL